MLLYSCTGFPMGMALKRLCFIFLQDVDTCGPTVTSFSSNAVFTPSCTQKHLERDFSEGRFWHSSWMAALFYIRGKHLDVTRENGNESDDTISLLVREGINLSLGSTWIDARGKRDRMEPRRRAGWVAFDDLAVTGDCWLKLHRCVLVINLFVKKTPASCLFLLGQHPHQFKIFQVKKWKGRMAAQAVQLTNLWCMFESCVGLFSPKMLTVLHLISVKINSIQLLVLT